jgi:hypothetical protein
MLLLPPAAAALVLDRRPRFWVGPLAPSLAMWWATALPASRLDPGMSTTGVHNTARALSLELGRTHASIVCIGQHRVSLSLLHVCARMCQHAGNTVK